MMTIQENVFVGYSYNELLNKQLTNNDVTINTNFCKMIINNEINLIELSKKLTWGFSGINT